VDAAVLADFPADGHALEELVFENQITCVIPFGKENILVERLRAHGVANDIVLYIFESEVALGNGSEALDPIRDGERLDGELIWHDKEIIPPKRRRNAGKEEQFSKTRYSVG
jgi:hypothetical protein